MTVKGGKGLPTIKIRPVGIVKSQIKEPRLVVKWRDLEWKGVLEDARQEQSMISEILISDDFTGILDGIEDFSHILVLYWAHLASEEDRSIIKAHPMGRKDLPEVGIFATCSPVRPNPICVSAVSLLERNGNILKVEHLDAVDGSPVIDIKPYAPSYYNIREVKVSKWMEQIEREFTQTSKNKQ
ncbi:MAG: tRNA (N6-threonylcarbamoyladenosine(37)-N6)-methyltransferase TrmO [Chloroflexota bacterium]